MAIHSDLESLIKESLHEYLCVAEYCVRFRKDSSWPAEQRGGCLGYPAAVMLFSIVDTIGSFHRGDRGFRVAIEDRTCTIRKSGYEHFFVLNSDYYARTLNLRTIKSLYVDFRSLLVHNASLPPLSSLIYDSSIADAFSQSEGRMAVNLPEFLNISRRAVQLFLTRLDAIVPSSQQAAVIRLKSR